MIKILRGSCRIKFQRTAGLKDDLLYDRWTATLHLLRHNTCVISHLDSRDVLPKGFVAGTSWTPIPIWRGRYPQISVLPHLVSGSISRWVWRVPVLVRGIDVATNEWTSGAFNGAFIQAGYGLALPVLSRDCMYLHSWTTCKNAPCPGAYFLSILNSLAFLPGMVPCLPCRNWSSTGHKSPVCSPRKGIRQWTFEQKERWFSKGARHYLCM